MTKGLLVTGGTGFVGKALLDRLPATKKRPITAVLRCKEVSLPVEVSAVWGGELWANTDWSNLLHRVDVVIHCAARTQVINNETSNALDEYRRVNVHGTLTLAQKSIKAGVSRFVYISSIKVNGEHTTSSIPFRADDLPAPEDAYGISKFEAEQGLLSLGRKTGMEVVIIRPPLVYGPGVKGNFASMVSWVRKGLPIPFDVAHNKRSFVALDNLVDFITLCADPELSPNAANEVFLISDGEDVSTTELLRKVANAYEVTLHLLPIPASWTQAVAKLLGRYPMVERLLGSLVIDSSKSRDLLGWKPVVSMDEQLKKMARSDKSI